MAHYAILDDDNLVLQVITGVDEDETESLPDGFDNCEAFYSSIHGNKTIIRTSYNTLEGFPVTIRIEIIKPLWW